jgi:hypothetical protein
MSPKFRFGVTSAGVEMGIGWRWRRRRSHPWVLRLCRGRYNGHGEWYNGVTLEDWEWESDVLGSGDGVEDPRFGALVEDVLHV